MTINIAKVLTFKLPGAQWSLHGNEYDGLIWLDENIAKPTLEEIQNYAVEYEQHLERIKYKELRAAEYPSIVDQFDILYHQGYDGWKTVIQAVKDKYPKPE